MVPKQKILSWSEALLSTLCVICGPKSSCSPKRTESSLDQASQRLFKRAKSKATGAFKATWTQEAPSHTARPAEHNPENSGSSWYSKFKAVFPIWSVWTG